MATTSLVLRFRELTPGIDTIVEHERILHSEDYVWWGWWKKLSEPNRRDELDALIRSLERNKVLGAFLIDTSAERMHRATFDDVCIGSLPSTERQRVPQYYRTATDVAAWFKIKSIVMDIQYDPQIESIVGQDTLAVIQRDEL